MQNVKDAQEQLNETDKQKSLIEENGELKNLLCCIKAIRSTQFVLTGYDDAWQFYKIDERINELTSK